MILKDLSNIIKDFKDLPYKGYFRKRFKHMPSDSYFYLTIQLAKFVMINSRGPVITQNMGTQKMSNSKISTQNIPNLHVCYTDER